SVRSCTKDEEVFALQRHKCLPTRLPRQIFALQGLRVLEMTPERESCLRYRMDLVPREIGHLQNLAFLYLDSNNLKEVPAEIGSLGKLERLTLSNNSIASLPEEIGGLQKLHSLHLANNSLAELPAPALITPGSYLCWIDVSQFHVVHCNVSYALALNLHCICSNYGCIFLIF
uniref:Uncharacterized protein n=1 Tax=Podarcis muralis TaxID=64176 RepID=A0A670JJA3_PODMU